MEIKQSILGPDRAQIALQALFFQVSQTVQQSISNAEEINQHEVAIKKLHSNSRLLHAQAFSEIIFRYPYSSLRIEDEKIFREMCLRTKPNIMSLELEKDIRACVQHYNSNNILGADAAKKLQAYVNFNITNESRDTIMAALKQRENAAKKKSNDLHNNISRWIANIKEALKKRAENWAQLSREFASFAPNETLKLLPSATDIIYDEDFLKDIVVSSTSDHQLSSDSLLNEASTLLYPTIDPFIFTTDVKDELGKFYYSK